MLKCFEEWVKNLRTFLSNIGRPCRLTIKSFNFKCPIWLVILLLWVPMKNSNGYPQFMLYGKKWQNYLLFKWGEYWRSGKGVGLRTKGSLVQVPAAAQFVVALSKSHLPPA